MSIRTERIAKLIQRDVADLLNTEFSEQIQPMVTVTHVRVTRDLSIAYVYVSVFGADKAHREAALRRLDELNPKIRAALAQRIRHQMRKMPELRFFLDETLEEAQKMEDLFKRIRAERERRGES
ncbi:MAG: 30S ribosome-binding factor RbfA [Bacteroidetes bacterium]|nr:ribosome-binding factor A [Rhodothermaceae bacterium RA]RMH66586.1 MAG: 30S ribosome-binding factor RbfA [Bacteroidota bacterium]